MSKKSEKPIFKNMIIAVACSLGGQWTDTNISRWVSRRGGVLTSEMTDQVTHFICPVEEYKSKTLRVKQAAKLGAKQCKIVTLDWLEDSLFKSKKLPVKDYLLNAVLKNERAQELDSIRIAKGIDLAARFVNTNLFHIYADSTDFFYEITLTRDVPEAGWEGQKYIFYLFESNAKPHLYQFAAKFYQKHRDCQPKYHRPSETAQTFETEYEKFKGFFQKKTGIDWDERLIQISLDDSAFQYKPPTGGKPVGYVPEAGQPKPSSLSFRIKAEVEAKPSLPQIDHGIPLAAVIDRLGAKKTQDVNQETIDPRMLSNTIKQETMDLDTTTQDAANQDHTLNASRLDTSRNAQVDDDTKMEIHLDTDMDMDMDTNTAANNASPPEPPGVYSTMSKDTPATSPYFTYNTTS